MDVENHVEYTRALKQAQKYHTEVEGLTKYVGLTDSDKHYPKMLNVQIILLTQISSRIMHLQDALDELNQKIKVLATHQAIDDLEAMFKELNIEKGEFNIKTRPKTWKTW